MAFLVNNPSPLLFNNYNPIPMNLEHFCSKFHVGDPKRIVEEHIKIFQTSLGDREIFHEDVSYRFFPYSLGEEDFYWYNHFPVGSLTNWNDLENTFLLIFKIPISTNELYL